MKDTPRSRYMLAGKIQGASFELMQARDELDYTKSISLRVLQGRLMAIVEQIDTVLGQLVPHPQINEE
jgi:hypothetical protein